MRNLRYPVCAVLATSLLSPIPLHAQSSGRGPRVGEAYEITLTRDSSEEGTDGSSGTTHDQDAIVERVVGVLPDGLELEYDLPKDASATERKDQWEFPALVFRPSHGPMQLLNRPQLEKRIDAWLKAAKWPRTICGHWIFTWNAFHIDCDPESVIDTISAFDLRSDIREGASYKDAHARSPALLVKNRGPAGTSFSAEMDVDPDVVRRERAESDVAIGEIMRKPVTLEAALHNHAAEAISGTISITFDTDRDGTVLRRTRVISLTAKESGKSETKTTKEILERKALP